MSFSRTRRNRRSDEADVDMTPMLDIVFIMLIFFIVTATFLDERGLDFAQTPMDPLHLLRLRRLYLFMSMQKMPSVLIMKLPNYLL